MMKVPGKVTTKEERVSQCDDDESLPPSSSTSYCCVRMWHYGGIPEAKGYALLAMSRGVATMSNIMVSAALLELASAAAGCPVGEGSNSIQGKCTNTIYGQNPLSLISNIAVVSGLLSAFFMPVSGAILDYTAYRRAAGIVASTVFALIQAAQIGIGPRTWFAMAILQSIAGACFCFKIVVSIAYLPEICAAAGEEEHARYAARFTAKQFAAQASFLVLLVALSVSLGIVGDSVMTARLSQALNVVISAILIGVGWGHYMPPRPASRELPPGKCCLGVLAHGLRQNIQTAKSIHRTYKKGLRWFLLASMFAQSGVGALTTLSVVYLSSEVGLNATDICLFFFVVLVGTVLGARLSPLITKRLDPNTSWQLSMVALFAVLAVGAFTVGDAPHKYLSLIWGFFVGAGLGWFYPTENLFFSCILPRGQEAEIAGFRMYCAIILSWLPPLIFTILVENGFDAKWGLLFCASFNLIAALLLKVGTSSWQEMLEESGRSGSAEEEFVSEGSP